jgi:hypothetical protein
LTETAENVRVFFRLFPAASTGSAFDDTTLYRSTSLTGTGQDTVAASLPSSAQSYNQPPIGTSWATRVPLLGMGPPLPSGSDILTIPFFATQRVDATSVPMSSQPPDWPNVQQIQPGSSGNPVYAFFGCWLDINVQSPTLNGGSPVQFPETVPTSASSMYGPYRQGPYQPISWFLKSQQQCIVAEIAYDPLPISSGAVPGQNDKLAQRNLFVQGGTNTDDWTSTEGWP